MYYKKLVSYGTADGQFSNPYGITTNSSGNVYVVDEWNRRVQKFDSNGQFITKLGSYGTADGQFDTSQGIAVDSSGNLYVADTYNNRIKVFSPSS